MRGARAGALAALLIAGGCGPKTPEQPVAPIDSVQLNAIASSGPTVAEVLAQGNDTTPARDPRRPAAFAYAGDWAADPRTCAPARWRFADAQVMVGAKERCAIGDAEPRTDSEMRLEVTCTPAGGRIRTDERWSLVRRDDGSMIVARTAGNSVPESVTLRRCG